MCLICDRIQMIKDGTNPYFVKELETGYVVIGDHQHFHGYTLFLCKKHKTELDQLDRPLRDKFLSEMADVAAAMGRAFPCEKINYELLGMGDAHLHWHLNPRRPGDLEGYGYNERGPIGWYPHELMYDNKTRPSADELEKMKQKLLSELESCE